MGNKYNFYAGPSILPKDVLVSMQEDLKDYKGTGLSLLETSHRTPGYEEVHQSAISLIKEMLGVGDNFKVLFLGGGATMQFSMVPLNFMKKGGHADYTLTGAWAKKAYADAAIAGDVNVAFDGKDSGYSSLPEPSSLKPSEGADYFHITSNETIGGVQWKDFPDTGDVPLIADMSSDFLSRRIPAEKFSLMYGGVQKNLGPAGSAFAVIREDLLERCPVNLPVILNYNVHAANNSLYNTPTVYTVWAVSLVLKRMKKLGGIEAMEKANRAKSALVYSLIDQNPEFYRSPVDKSCRSDMNVVFRLPSQELEKAFLAGAEKEGMLGLKGHRSVGGCRASLYNATEMDHVQVLADYMAEFVRKNG